VWDNVPTLATVALCHDWNRVTCDERWAEVESKGGHFYVGVANRNFATN
jgi:hypothetical protein